MLTNVNPRYRIRHRGLPKLCTPEPYRDFSPNEANLDLWNRAARFSVLLILNSRGTIPIKPATNQALFLEFQGHH